MSDSLQPYVARQVPLSMGFSRQEYWSGLPYPPPGDLPNPGIEPMSFTSPALAGRFFTTSATWEVTVVPENKKCESCPTHFINLAITLIPKLEKGGKSGPTIRQK